MELVLNIAVVNRLMAVPNIWFTESVLKFIEYFNYLNDDLCAFMPYELYGSRWQIYHDTLARFMYLPTWPIRFVSHERIHVVVQFLIVLPNIHNIRIHIPSFIEQIVKFINIRYTIAYIASQAHAYTVKLLKCNCN